MTSSSRLLIAFVILLYSCIDKPVERRTPEQVILNASEVKEMAAEIRGKVAAVVDSSLTLSLWGVDSLVADPIALDIDDKGRVYITRTNRQKNSEFDIRSHKDWEIGSISLQTVNDRREFLKRELSPDSSDVNDWLADLNNDGSRDWKDLQVQKEQIFLIEDTDNDGLADKSSIILEDFNEIETDCAGGLEIFENQIYMGVGPDMWQLSDKNKDGYFESHKSIGHGFNVHIGFGAHGMSGAEMGPDGRLYWGIGDVGFNGKGPDGQEWKYPNRGVIVRSEPDGSNFEVFAMGLRNTHEFVFDKYANLISEDNDGDHPTEKERLVYVVEGSDTGWRINWQFGKYNDPKNNRYKVWMDERLNVPRWDGQAAHITPCIENYVNGPTGMLYNPGTALSPKWKDHFFIVEFVGNPGGSGIHAFQLNPKGATFELKSTERIVNGILPTGLDWGPDGAMYAGDWINGWQTKNYGRIWKLDDATGANWNARKTTKELIARDFSQIEISNLKDLLANDDMRIRQKAQFELVKRGDDGASVFNETLSDVNTDQLARVHSVIGLSQMSRTVNKKYAEKIIPFLNDSDPEIQAQSAKWLGDLKYKKAGDDIIPLLKSTSPRTRFFAAEALGRMSHATAHQRLVTMLLENDDEDAYLRHAGSLALARIGNAKELVALHNHESKALRTAAVVALRRMAHKGVAQFLNDPEVSVVRDAARAINDDFSIPDALDDLGAILEKQKDNDEAIIRRAINANLRVGTEAALTRVINYALNESNPKSLRVEAIAAITHWANPSVLDRVDGRLRGKMTRSTEMVRKAFEEPLLALLNDKSTKIQAASIEAIGINNINATQFKLAQMLKDSKNSNVRMAAITSLIKLQVPEIKDYLTRALKDDKRKVRVAALNGLTGVPLAEKEKLSLLESVIFDQSVSEKQAAIAALTHIPLAASKSTFGKLLSNWENGQLIPEIRLDVAEAIAATNDKTLIDRVEAIQTKSANSTDVMAFYMDCLTGGDAGKGSRIFWNHTGAQCTRCHEMADFGGHVGPPLKSIANTLSPEDLLASLVKPSGRIAPGYGMVSLMLNDDSEVDGMLLEESITEIKVRNANNEVLSITKSDVAERIDALSGMPDMTKVLSKQEIRDLMAYLLTLKSPS